MTGAAARARPPAPARRMPAARAPEPDLAERLQRGLGNQALAERAAPQRFDAMLGGTVAPLPEPEPEAAPPPGPERPRAPEAGELAEGGPGPGRAPAERREHTPTAEAEPAPKDTPAESREAEGAVPEGAAREGATPGSRPPETAPEIPAPPAPAEAGTAIGILDAAPPSRAAEAVIAARSAAAEEVTTDRKALAENPPALEAPVGLRAEGVPPATLERPRKGKKAEAARVDEQEGQGPEQPPVDTTAPPTTAPLPAREGLTQALDRSAEEPGDIGFLALIRRVIARLPSADSGVTVDAGETPRFALTGEADPGRYDTQALENRRRAAAQDAEARQAMQEDEGVDAIFPAPSDEVLRAEIQSTKAPAPPVELTPVEIDARIAAGFDTHAAGKWAEAQAEARGRHDEAMRVRESDEDAAWVDTQARIREAESAAAAEQQAEKAGAHGAVAEARARWAADLDAARTTYESTETATRESMRTQVETARADSEAKAERELRQGEARALARKRAAEREAARKRAEAREKENESDGFWGWVKSKVKSFIDRIRKAINAIFDAMRAAVRRIIEGAKKLAAAAIELGRRAVVGAIRLAGAALELAADVFLAAFPEARDRAKAAIRRGVDAAEEAVNRIAEGLKKAVNALLDLLGAALDAILAAYQAAYNLLLDAIEFVAVFLIDMMQGIEQLIRAAMAMPDHFEGQVQEELLGMDLTQPLPFERTESTSPDSAVRALPTADRELFAPRPLDDTQIEVDAVAPFDPDPELLSSLPLGENDEIEFGHNDDPANTIAALREELAPDAAAGPEAGPAAVPTGAEAGPDLAAMTDDERLDLLIAQEPEGTCTKEKPAAEEGGGFPEHLKFGPLGRAQRARYLLAQMWKGIKSWFACNWPILLAAAIAIIAGVVILEIVTAGAVTAALPFILTALTAVMVGVALVRAGSYLIDYLTKAWDGDIAGGAKALARAIAIGAVELIFAVLTYLTAGAARVLAAAVKGAGRAAAGGARLAARGARAVGRTTARGGRALGRAALRTTGRAGAAVMRGGKIVMRGLRRGWSRGAKSLDDLARRLKSKFRFRKFKIRRRGRRIQLWGYINPWVLMADGNIERMDNLGDDIEVGSLVDVPGRRTPGIVVGIKTRAGGGAGASAAVDFESAAVRNLRAESRAARIKFHREHRTSTPEGIREALDIASETSRNSRILAKNMKANPRPGRPTPRTGDHAHHLVPSTDPRGKVAQGILKKYGIDINGPENGIFLDPKKHARMHTNAGYQRINNMLSRAKNKTEAMAALDRIAELIMKNKFP